MYSFLESFRKMCCSQTTRDPGTETPAQEGGQKNPRIASETAKCEAIRDNNQSTCGSCMEGSRRDGF